MRKISEIDAAKSYQITGEAPLLNSYSWRGRKHRVNPKWFEQHFTTAQQQILEQHGYSLRPHPRHSPTMELFIDETDLTDRDWTVIHLLF